MTDTFNTYPPASVIGLINAMVRKLKHSDLPPRPERVQLRRAKGWRMPPDTVKVDRTTKWGNPFVVGKDGTAAECVDLYCKMLRGYLAIALSPSIDDLKERRDYVLANIGTLKGKNLACWCRKGAACHAEVLLDLANHEAQP